MSKDTKKSDGFLYQKGNIIYKAGHLYNKLHLQWLVLILLCLVFLSISVTAEIQTLGVFKQNECITLRQICADCTYNNISSVVSPSSIMLLSNIAMYQQSTEFNYTFCNTIEIGQYLVNGVGDLNGINTIWNYDFEITKTGTSPSTAQGMIYFVLIAVSLGLFIIILFIGFNIKTERFDRDSITGKVTEVNWKRYYKIGCWFIAYMLAVWITHLSYEISNNFLNSTFLNGFFHTLFIILLSLATPFTITFFIMFLVSFIVDKKTQKLLERGLQP